MYVSIRHAESLPPFWSIRPGETELSPVVTLPRNDIVLQDLTDAANDVDIQVEYATLSGGQLPNYQPYTGNTGRSACEAYGEGGTTDFLYDLCECVTSGTGCNPFPRIFWYHADHLGSTEFVTDLSGMAYEHYFYSPWGEVMVAQNANNDGYSSPYRFSAKEADPETGLSYFGARYYNPRTSIWLSVDPMAHMREWLTPYNYVQNNPVMYFDPTGVLDTGPEGAVCETCPKDGKEGDLHPELGKDGKTIWKYLKTKEGWVPTDSDGGELDEVVVTGQSKHPGYDVRNEFFNYSNLAMTSEFFEWAYSGSFEDYQRDYPEYSRMSREQAMDHWLEHSSEAYFDHWNMMVQYERDKVTLQKLSFFIMGIAAESVILSPTNYSYLGSARSFVWKPGVAKVGAKPTPNFKTPTNSPQLPLKEVPKGMTIRVMRPTKQYPNGYWRLEKPMPQGGAQGINPSTMKPGAQHETHVPLPPGYWR